ncbi:MAG: hypothetical protein FWB77_05230 [Treponema sp.]|nr:hypothetical protein [Treponema sp.]
MKKAEKKTAIILLIVLIINTFSGCLSWWLMTGKELNLGSTSGPDALGIIFLPILDIICLPVAFIVFGIRMAIEAERNERGEKYDRIDTFSAIAGSLSGNELQLLMKKFDSVSDKELDYLIQRFYLLSDEEINSYTNTINSLSDSNVSIIMNTVSNSCEAQISASIEKLNSMPEERFITTINKLQDIGTEVNYEN